jgi:hypothetical protein
MEDPHEGSDSDYGNDYYGDQATPAQPTECLTRSIERRTRFQPV